MDGLWRFPFHDKSQGNQQSNMIAQSKIKHKNTGKHWFQHIKPMALRNPRSYRPTYQQELSIFYNNILCCPKQITLLQAINDGSFSTRTGITAKRITNYLPES